MRRQRRTCDSGKSYGTESCKCTEMACFEKCNADSKLVPEYVMKAHKEVEEQLHSISTSVHRSIYSRGKSRWCPTNRKLRGLQGRSQRDGEVAKSLVRRVSEMLPSSPARIREGQGCELAVLVNIKKALRGNGSSGPLILNLAT